MFNIKKLSLTLVLLGCITFGVSAQKSLLKTAEHHYESLSFIKAIDAFETVLKKKGISGKEKTDAQIKLADSYYKVKDTDNAERIYRDIIESGADLSGENAQVILRYAQVLASNGKYKDSQEQYDNYTSKSENDLRGKGFSKLYNDISVLSKNANCYKVDYLTINTNAADFSPAYYQNGLVFISNRKTTAGVRKVFNWNNTPFLDLYHLDDVAYLGGEAAGLGGGSSKIKAKNVKSPGTPVGSDEYTAPTANDSRTIGTYGGGNASRGYGYGDKPITPSDRMDGSINSKYHEGPAAFFKDGSKVIFTRNNFLNGKARKSSDGINKLKLYMGEAKKDSWGQITELPFNSDEYSCGHPALSADEKLLFFASDMPGGFGGTDIYVSRYDGSGWSAPINLGKTVNTKGNEMFPFVDDKGNLYFSSEGHPGLGELDIFYTQLDGITQKGRIINLGAPINSSKDDFGLVTDGTRQSGYFSSNRKRGGDDDDIYKFDRECEIKEGCELILAIYDAETKMPLDNVNVKFTDKEGNIYEGISDVEGNIMISDLAADDEFTFTSTREGYVVSNITYSTEECDNEPSRLEIPLSRPVEPVNEADSLKTTDPNSLANNENTVGDSQKTDLNESVNGDPNSVLNGKKCIIKGKVSAQNNNSSIKGVLVSLRNECNGSVQTAYTDDKGNYQFTAVEGCDYTIEGSKDNMASKGNTIKKLNCNKGNNVADVYMFTTGDVVALDNVYFDYGKCNLRKDGKAELDKVVSMMRKYPKMTIELRAHTDSRSEAEFNQKISEGRAKASADYLFKRGISRSRVTYKGFGETMPVNGCVDGVECSEEQHAKNRRTEIRIVQMN